MNKYIKDMMHERELIYDAKKAIHKEDKKYKASGQIKGSVMHIGHSPLTKHCTSALRYGSPMKQEDAKEKESKDACINRMLDKVKKEKPEMSPSEMMEYAKNSCAMIPTK